MNPFVGLLERLARAEVHLVLVGSLAVLMQGHPRTAQDVDILVEASEENARRPIGALTGWGEGAEAGLRIDELAVPQAEALRIIEDFPLDVFTLMRARAAGRDQEILHGVRAKQPADLTALELGPTTDSNDQGDWSLFPDQKS